MKHLNNRPVFRFAPSPNGNLHLGHAFSALYSWKKAREYGGTFLVRIEDIDTSRSRQEYIDQILDDLAWLGLVWDEPVLRQSKRLDAYKDALSVLQEKGLVYPSTLTRKEIQALPSTREKDPDGSPLIYKEDEVDVRREDTAWRLDIQKAQESLTEPVFFEERETGPGKERGNIPINPQMWGNIILARKHIPTSYHLSVVVDDSYQNVTHVTRGEDLFYATHIHALLQKLLNLPTPLYFHHTLIDDETGRKLSKSALDKSLKSMREEGLTRDDILKHLPIKL